MSRLGVLLNQLETYEFHSEVLNGKALENSEAWSELRAMATDMDRVLATTPADGAKALVADRAAQDPNVSQPASASQRKVRVIYSEVVLPGIAEPQVIGWDTCGKCHLHVRICKCADGPTQPPSIQKWMGLSGQDGTPKTSAYGVTVDKRAAHVVEDVELPPLVPDRFDRQDPEVVDLPEGVCNGCGIAATLDNADQNDDGSWTCFTCQTGGDA